MDKQFINYDLFSKYIKFEANIFGVPVILGNLFLSNAVKIFPFNTVEWILKPRMKISLLLPVH